MTTLYQSNLFTTVNRINTGELSAQTFLLGTGYEAVGRLRAKTDTFEILEACWDIYRSPGGKENGGETVAALTGVEAYFSASKALQAVAQEHGELPKNLLAECVRGVIQAETYLFRERGFPTAEAYDALWKEDYAGSCRMYSNQERLTRSWFEHIANRTEGACLFNRSKHAAVRLGADGGWVAVGGFADSFHEIGVELVLDRGVVNACSGNFLRAPDPVCFECSAFLAALVGEPVAALTKGKLGKTAGGPQGCSHLVDLLDHVLSAVRELQLSGCR